MNTYVGTIPARTIAKSGVVLLARVVGLDAEPITQSTIETVSYLVRDIDGKISSDEFVANKNEVIFDTLQTGGGWEDEIGYNFRLLVPASLFNWEPDLEYNGNPKPRRFRVDVSFVPTGNADGQFVVPFSLFVIPAWISV